MSKNRIHLIPGPVNTHQKVKEAISYDIAPWSKEFNDIYISVKDRLIQLANGVPNYHYAALIPGCGHFVMETILRSYVPVKSKILIPNVGNYARRLMRLAASIGLEPVEFNVDQNNKLDPVSIGAYLDLNPDIKYLGLIYSETGTGIVHDIHAISTEAAKRNVFVLVDAVSAFGALPIDLKSHPEILAVGATANKCLESIPGLGIILYSENQLNQGISRSWSFNLFDIHEYEELTHKGKPRFTPAVNPIMGLNVSLELLKEEGGWESRLNRYTNNMKLIYNGMRHMGINPVLGMNMQGPIVINFLAPNKLAWNVESFSEDLYNNGVVVSPWAPLDVPSFRIGCIGALNQNDIDNALSIIRTILPKHFGQSLT